jgi:spectinomycin phosphotransferase
MLEKPDLPDDKIIACLQTEYGLLVATIAFLPLGADLNTAVYRVITDDETHYFLKLRGGVFDEASVALPKFLSDQGIAQVIAPLATSTGQLWANLDTFKVILYPFVEGRNGYEVELSDHHWIEFGAALKRIHSAVVPPSLSNHIQRETYSPRWREIVKTALARVETDAFVDPVAVKLAVYLKAKRAEILNLVGRTERLAQTLQAQAPEGVVCHADLHAGNILIDAAGALYIIDWDTLICAPKERDLMYAGGGQFGEARTPQQEESLFYQGYGQTPIDHRALAYYRYERIIQDVAVECEQIFSATGGGEDRAQALRYFTSNFLPGGVLEITYQSDKIYGERQAQN